MAPISFWTPGKRDQTPKHCLPGRSRDGDSEACWPGAPKYSQPQRRHGDTGTAPRRPVWDTSNQSPSNQSPRASSSANTNPRANLAAACLINNSLGSCRLWQPLPGAHPHRAVVEPAGLTARASERKPAAQQGLSWSQSRSRSQNHAAESRMSISPRGFPFSAQGKLSAGAGGLPLLLGVRTAVTRPGSGAQRSITS